MKSIHTFLALVFVIFLLSASKAFGQLRIAVLDTDDDIVDALNHDPRLEGVYLSNSLDLDSTFDAVMCVRSRLDTNVVNFVENGYGGIVGEYISNEDIINQGWISGTVPVQRGTALQSISTLSYNKHYLYSAIDWNSIPFGTNSWHYAPNLTITDTDAQVVATANHSVYGEIPFVATKQNPYGDGAIVILNSDWRDDPDYDSETINTINECAYYAASASQTKIAIVPLGSKANSIAAVINKDFRMNAIAINSDQLDSTYKAVVCYRTGFDTNVVNYIENGYGGFVGEYTANDSAVSRGWFNGTAFHEGASGITSLNTNYYPNHYLSNEIDWTTLPYSSNPLYYAYRFDIADSNAYVVATVNHTTYGENPLVVTKTNPYGIKQGNIVLLNCDYADDPDFNVNIENMIQECAFYATVCNELKVAVVPITSQNQIMATVISMDPRMYAENIHPDALDSTYDAVFSVRNFSPEVKAYVESGYGGFVGEWSSNDSIISNNWIIGTVNGSGSGIQTLNSNFNSQHYLNKNIHFTNIPYSTNSFYYARNISIDDSLTNIVATVDHNSFGEIPFVVTRKSPFGPGAIVIGNSDYRDDPDYDAATINFIQELAYYACEGYEQDFYEISINVEGSGTTDPANKLFIPYASTDTVLILPNEYHHIHEILIDSIQQATESLLIFENEIVSQEVDITIVIDTFKINATSSIGGIISPMGTSELLPYEDIRYTYNPAVGYQQSGLLIDGLPTDSTKSYSFLSVVEHHTIHAEFEMEQFDIIATSGANGSISPIDIVSVNYGSDQLFTFNPAPGYSVSDLWVDGDNIGAPTSYTFEYVTDPHIIHANFVKTGHEITVVSSAGGSISPNAPLPILDGENITFYILPDIGYHLKGLLIDSVSTEMDTTYTFRNVSTAHSIEALFSLIEFNITSTVGDNGIIIPNGTVPVLYGADQEFVIVPNPNFAISEVSISGNPIDLSELSDYGNGSWSYTFENVTDSHIIHVNFVKTRHEITATSSAGGSISPNGPLPILDGENITFDINPDTGYHLAELLIDDVSTELDTTYTFRNVLTDHSIEVIFSLIEYTISATSSAGGSLSPNEPLPIPDGENITFNLIPDMGYQLSELLIDGVSTELDTTYTFRNVSTTHSIEAIFSLIEYSITAATGDNGIIIPSGIVPVLYGADQEFVIVSDPNFTLSEVSISDNPIDLSELIAYGNGSWSYTFTGINSDNEIQVTFEEEPITGIQPSDLEDFSIYPNPFSDKLTIENITDVGKIYYKLKNINSSDIIVGEFDGESITINVSGLSDGIYILSLYTKDLTWNIKVIKN